MASRRHDWAGGQDRAGAGKDQDRPQRGNKQGKDECTHPPGGYLHILDRREAVQNHTKQINLLKKERERDPPPPPKQKKRSRHKPQSAYVS